MKEIILRKNAPRPLNFFYGWHFCHVFDDTLNLIQTVIFLMTHFYQVKI